MRCHVAMRQVSWLLLVSLTQAAFQNDFSSYPENAQQCLYTSATSSGCIGDTATAMNSCLCSNGGNFVTKTAACLGGSDAAGLATVYDTMDSHCTDTNTPLTVSKAQFLNASDATTMTSARASTRTSTPASAATTRASTAKTTATTSDSASTTSTGKPAATGSGKDNNGVDDGGGEETLSGTARAGIIAGSTSGGVLLLGLLAYVFVRSRRNNQIGREEADPMLLQKFSGMDGPWDGGRGMGMATTPHEGLEAVHLDGLDGAMPATDPKKWRQSQRFNWETPYEPLWSPVEEDSASKPEGTVQDTHEVDHHTEPPIHELASPEMQAPIELAAIPVDRTQYSGGRVVDSHPAKDR